MTTFSRTIVVLSGTIVLTLSGGPSALTLTNRPHDPVARASAAALEATGAGR